jgi:hypothetical protein
MQRLCGNNPTAILPLVAYTALSLQGHFYVSIFVCGGSENITLENLVVHLYFATKNGIHIVSKKQAHGSMDTCFRYSHMEASLDHLLQHILHQNRQTKINSMHA